MSVNLKNENSLKVLGNQTVEEVSAEHSPTSPPPASPPKDILLPKSDQKQISLRSFTQESEEGIKEKTVEVMVSKSFPVKFGLRKKLQKDKIHFEVVKSIIHLRMFDRIMIHIIDPREFDESALLKKFSLLSKKFSLIVAVFDFVEFDSRFEGEERLLKQKVKQWGQDNDKQAIPIGLPEELYFIVKNIYLHTKKELGSK